MNQTSVLRASRHTPKSSDERELKLVQPCSTVGACPLTSAEFREELHVLCERLRIVVREELRRSRETLEVVPSSPPTPSIPSLTSSPLFSAKQLQAELSEERSEQLRAAGHGRSSCRSPDISPASHPVPRRRPILPALGDAALLPASPKPAPKLVFLRVSETEPPLPATPLHCAAGEPMPPSTPSRRMKASILSAGNDVMRAVQSVGGDEQAGDEDDLLVDLHLEEATGCRLWVRKIVLGGTLDFLIFVVILTNSLTIGLQVDYEARHIQGEGTPDVYEVLEVIFCLIYLVEWSFRVFVLRGRFLLSFGNLFDSSLIALQVVEVIAKVIESATGQSPFAQSLSMMATWRCIRLMRALRLLRIVRFFEELSNLVYLLFASCWSFIWAALLLVVLTYITGTFITQIVADHRAGMPDHEDVLSPPYGSISRTMLSLYASILGGVDWQEIMEVLAVVSPLMPFTFALYVAFSTLVLLNLVTGVFVDTAQRLREKDRHKELQMGLKRAIKKAQVDMDQLISTKEFAQLTETDDFIVFLEGHNLNSDSVRTVFNLLHEREGDISPGRFIDFCLRLQGLGNAIELAKMHLTGDRDRELLKLGHLKGAEERSQLMHLHQQAAEERVELKMLHEIGARGIRDLKDLHARAFEDRAALDGRLAHIQTTLLQALAHGFSGRPSAEQSAERGLSPGVPPRSVPNMSSTIPPG